jgi:putative RNA 2'-phosphotransferase
MASDDDVALSRFISLVLRHRPARAGITLDEQGYADVAELLAGCARAGRPLTRAELERIVRESDKQRFAFNADGTRLRASQGHSLPVTLGYAPATPPARLYHGTVAAFLPSIRARGLERGQRQHVHLSRARETAIAVGRRRGQPVVLTVLAVEMADAGFVFYESANGVWLTDAVPARFLLFP